MFNRQPKYVFCVVAKLTHNSKPSVLSVHEDRPTAELEADLVRKYQPGVYSDIDVNISPLYKFGRGPLTSTEDLSSITVLDK